MFQIVQYLENPEISRDLVLRLCSDRVEGTIPASPSLALNLEVKPSLPTRPYTTVSFSLCLCVYAFF